MAYTGKDLKLEIISKGISKEFFGESFFSKFLKYHDYGSYSEIPIIGEAPSNTGDVPNHWSDNKSSSDFTISGYDFDPEEHKVEFDHKTIAELLEIFQYHNLEESENQKEIEVKNKSKTSLKSILSDLIIFLKGKGIEEGEISKILELLSYKDNIRLVEERLLRELDL